MGCVKYITGVCSYCKSKRVAYAVINDNCTIGRCTITVKKNQLTISEWYVSDWFSNRGIGRELLTFLIKYSIGDVGDLKEVLYIWNGANEYVYDWLVRNFNAEVNLSIQEQKNSYDDTKDGHFYKLDIDMFKDYFDIK